MMKRKHFSLSILATVVIFAFGNEVKALWGWAQTESAGEAMESTGRSYSLTEFSVLPSRLPPSNCNLTVRIETNNSTAYIEEMVAYYRSHGAYKVIIWDHSDFETGQIIQRKLERLIKKGIVEYGRDTERFNRRPQDAKIAEHVQTWIKKYFQEDRRQHQWLLTVDDDEYLFPDMQFSTVNLPEMMDKLREDEGDRRTVLMGMEQNRSKILSLCEFLTLPQVLQYPVVRFFWRQVGTSNILDKMTNATLRDKLDIEVYHRAEKYYRKNKINTLYTKRTGKCAYQINHPLMSIYKWFAQDAMVVKRPGGYNNAFDRKGGTFFLHGHQFFFYDNELQQIKHHIRSNFSTKIRRPRQDKVVNVGSTYHFTRSIAEYYGRNEAWGTLGRTNRAYRDKNHLNDNWLVRWAQRMRNEGWVHDTSTFLTQDYRAR